MRLANSLPEALHQRCHAWRTPFLDLKWCAAVVDVDTLATHEDHPRANRWAADANCAPDNKDRGFATELCRRLGDEVD